MLVVLSVVAVGGLSLGVLGLTVDAHATPPEHARPAVAEAVEQSCLRYQNHHQAIVGEQDVAIKLDQILEECGTLVAVAPVGGQDVLIVWTTECLIINGLPNCQAMPE